MTEVDPQFSRQLRNYGGFDFGACFNCGNCTGICNLSAPGLSFPREMMRMSVIGLKNEIKASLKPWLCYYCGECSTHCPQAANPGELMMSLRRWLTTQYDWTGLSGIFCRSAAASVAAFIITALAVFIFALDNNFTHQYIMKAGHIFEMAAIVSVFIIILIPNLIRMWWFTVLKQQKKIGISIYAGCLRDLFLHMFTQKNTLTCDGSRFRWFEHLVLVFGYLGLLITTVFLDWFNSNNLLIILMGYIESIVIMAVTADFIYSRIKKRKEMNKYSQPSDWFFVIWLFTMGITAFAVRLFIDMGLIEKNFWLYMIHLVILAQWALIIVPFGKWTHFLYRSFAIYFAAVTGLPLPGRQ